MRTLRGIVQAHYLTTQYLHAYIFVTQKIPISAHYSVHARLNWDRSLHYGYYRQSLPTKKHVWVKLLLKQVLLSRKS